MRCRGDQHSRALLPLRDPSRSQPSCQARRGVEDYVALLPGPLRPLAEKTHWQLSRLSLAGIHSDQLGERLPFMPSRQTYRAALQPKSDTDRLDALTALSCYAFVASVPALVANLARSRPDNPCAHAQVRKVCDHVLGPQPDAEHADRAARKLLLAVHPDKIGRLAFTNPLQEHSARSTHAMLSDLRTLLQDPCFGRRVYAPHRLAYGQLDGRRAGVQAAALLGLSVCLFVSVGLFWLGMAGCVTAGVTPRIFGWMSGAGDGPRPMERLGCP